jgi:hypothetical protein
VTDFTDALRDRPPLDLTDAAKVLRQGGEGVMGRIARSLQESAIGPKVARGIHQVPIEVAKDLVAERHLQLRAERQEILSRGIGDPMPSRDEIRDMEAWGYQMRWSGGTVHWQQSTTEAILEEVAGRAMGVLWAISMMFDPDFAFPRRPPD